MKARFTRMAEFVVDAWMATIPRRRPDPAALQLCKIVAHRGAHDDRHSVRENTIEAFERARASGIWGIEADIRWTADLVPVISHDPDTQRIFGRPVTIGEVTFAVLRAAAPEVPSLAEVVTRFGGVTHLMLELKAEAFPDMGRQRRILREHLTGLSAGDDYHFIALDPDLFETFCIRPRQCCLTIALDNMATIGDLALKAAYGGVTGHYFLLNDDIKRRHERIGQKAGTGFINSRNCLFREINRNVEWIFSDNAVALQRIIDAQANRQAERRSPARLFRARPAAKPDRPKGN